MLTLHQIYEEGCFIHLGWSLPISVWENKAVPHTSTCPYSFGVRKTFPNIVRTMDHSLGALLAQNNDQGHEQAIYYLSRTMIGVEHQYNPIEKECLALVFAVQKVWYYLVGQTIHVISKVNPFRLLMTKSSSLNGRLAKWAMLLSQYEMQFLSQKAVKQQTVADFLAEHPDPRTIKLYEDLPDEVAEVCLT